MFLNMPLLLHSLCRDRPGMNGFDQFLIVSLYPGPPLLTPTFLTITTTRGVTTNPKLARPSRCPDSSGPLHRARRNALASEHNDQEVFMIWYMWVYVSALTPPPTPTSVDAAPSARKAVTPSSLLVSTLIPNNFHFAG